MDCIISNSFKEDKVKTCKRCGGKIPVWVLIGDRVRNINNRSYCLDCSPFGQHNTRTLAGEQDLRKKQTPESSSRVCTSCGVEKPMEEFYFNSSKNRHHYECRTCFNGRSKEQQRKRKMEAVLYKGGKCVRCGYQGHLAVFDFHHLDRSKKSFEIGMFKNRSFAKIKSELDKCVLLCANCHRELEALGDDADWSFLK